jgi:cyanophycinase
MLIAALAAVFISVGGLDPAQAAPRHLVLLGGGDYSAGAMERFALWSGGPSGRVLFIPWASAEPEDYLKEFKDALSLSTPPVVEVAPATAAFAAGRAGFLKQLDGATAVFFCGGDQNRVSEFLKAEPQVREALQKRYKDGVLFSGTSAGTAVMSELMITGEGDMTALDGRKVGTDRGLGLLPGVILDQHFLVRQRENRLFGLVLTHPELVGVGVDAESAVAVTDERRAEVVGPGQTMVVRAAGPQRLAVELYARGESFELTGPGR